MMPLVPLPWVLLLLFGGGVLAYLVGLGSRALARWVSFLVAAAALVLYTPSYLIGARDPLVLFPGLGLSVLAGLDPLRWFFGFLGMGLGALVTFYDLERARRQPFGALYAAAFLWLLGSVVGIVASPNLLSLFFFWEVMTWTSYALILLPGGRARGAAYRYFLFSVAGAYFLLMGLLVLYARLGTLNLHHIALALQRGWIPLPETLLVFVLFSLGFGVKAAVMPLHVWAPDAYAEAPDGLTAFLSGALSKMGVFGFALLLLALVAGRLSQAGTVHGVSLPGYLLAWFGALTALLGALYAAFQERGKRLLAYSSISQLGYVLFGLGIGTPLALTGALFHALSHLLFKGLLFLAIGAVIHQAGTDEFAKLGGLVRRMPWTFVSVLVGVIALAGVPPTVGFPSKWLLYEAAIEKHLVFLAAVIFAASTAAFLYAYRFIFSVFLGQLQPENETVREGNLFLVLPQLILTALILWFGLFPGHALAWVDPILRQFHLPPLAHSAGRITTSLGTFDATVVGLAFLVTLILALAVFFLTARSRRVPQMDNYFAGEAPTQVSMHYATDFYRFLRREFQGLLRWSADRGYRWLADFVSYLAERLRRLYTGNGQTYVWYLVGFLALLLIFYLRGVS